MKPTIVLLLAFAAGCGAPCDEPGTICTVMGTGDAGLAVAGASAADSPLYWPTDVTIGPDGSPWLADWNNHRIIELPGSEDDRTVRLITGNAFVGDGPWETVPASQALWNHPTNLEFRDDGTFVFAAWHNSRVIGVDPSADTTWLIAGNGARAFGGDDGPGPSAAFDLPSSVNIADDGGLYISDQANYRIRHIAPDGIITTVVGSGEGDFCGDDGPALTACLLSERSQDAEPAGRIDRDGTTLYIADTGNNRIRAVDLDTMTIRTVAGDGGSKVGTDGDALSFSLRSPRDVAVGPDGALYIADSNDHCIRKLVDGNLTTIAGVCGEEGFDGDHGDATEALLNKPAGIDVDPDGVVWVADTFNQRLRRIQPAEE